MAGFHFERPVGAVAFIVLKLTIVIYGLASATMYLQRASILASVLGANDPQLSKMINEVCYMLVSEVCHGLNARDCLLLQNQFSLYAYLIIGKFHATALLFKVSDKFLQRPCPGKVVFRAWTAS